MKETINLFLGHMMLIEFIVFADVLPSCSKRGTDMIQVSMRLTQHRWKYVPARTKYQSGSYGASSLCTPVFTISAHLGTTNLSLFFNTSVYAEINLGAATSRTVMQPAADPSSAIFLLNDVIYVTNLFTMNFEAIKMNFSREIKQTDT